MKYRWKFHCARFAGEAVHTFTPLSSQGVGFLQYRLHAESTSFYYLKLHTSFRLTLSNGFQHIGKFTIWGGVDKYGGNISPPCRPVMFLFLLFLSSFYHFPRLRPVDWSCSIIIFLFHFVIYSKRSLESISPVFLRIPTLLHAWHIVGKYWGHTCFPV